MSNSKVIYNIIKSVALVILTEMINLSLLGQLTTFIYHASSSFMKLLLILTYLVYVTARFHDHRGKLFYIKVFDPY